jgi:nitrate/nitrite-specific signal transduction histidine kinase
VRLFAQHRRRVGAMPRWGQHNRVRADEMPVRLHDVATGLAVGISLLKAAPAPQGIDARSGNQQAMALLEGSLAQLRMLTAATSAGGSRPRSRPQLAESLRREAVRLRIRLELDLRGNEDWLAPNLADMILLVTHEGLRNVWRHAGASDCRIAINLTTCPFSVRIRDWGAGLPEAMVGRGIQLLERMAADMGCSLDLTSQPGLGTELVLVGPVCPRDRRTTPAGVGMSANPNSGASELTVEHAKHTAHGGQNSRAAGRLEG